MKIIRSDRPFQETYNLLKSLDMIPKDNFQEYEKVNWEHIGTLFNVQKFNKFVRLLSREEFDLIKNKNTSKFSDQRIQELDFLFFTLAKLQTEYDIMDYFRG